MITELDCRWGHGKGAALDPCLHACIAGLLFGQRRDSPENAQDVQSPRVSAPPFSAYGSNMSSNRVQSTPWTALWHSAAVIEPEVLVRWLSGMKRFEISLWEYFRLFLSLRVIFILQGQFLETPPPKKKKKPTLRAQILKKFKILKFSSELEIFKRATHQTPIFVGNSGGQD